ncbi:glycosyltransferase [bacterium]|nr:glycosyltransferase [bacterium]
MPVEKKPGITLMVITGTWPPMRCGVGDYTFTLCENLVQRDFHVHVFTSEQVRPNLPLKGLTRLEVHARVNRWSWHMLRTLAEAIAELKPDVVNFQWPTAAYGRSLAVNWLPIYLRKKFPRLPLITTLHELRYFSPWSRLRIYPALEVSQRLILVDSLDRGCVSRIHAKAAARCCEIRLGSSLPGRPEQFNREDRRQSLGFHAQDFVVAFFGFANPPKGLENLFRALCMLRNVCPEIKLLMLSQFSDKNPYQRRILSELNATGLSAFTTRPEYAEPHLAAEYLASADCAVLPFVDGASLKRSSLIACLAQALPLITTWPAPPGVDDFEHNVNMLLVPPEDTAALAAALERLIKDPDLRLRLSRGSADLARKFSWKDITKRYAEVIKEVMEEMR